jgi:hypothetical protein
MVYIEVNIYHCDNQLLANNAANQSFWIDNNKLTYHARTQSTF